MSNEIFMHEREAPSIHPMDNVVNWSIFRNRKEAEDYLRHVQLGAGQEPVGGHGRDSIGEYWWVGVKVVDLGRWGGQQAIHKHGRLGD